ncbi:MAG: O-antigen ligase family protein [Candidatus Tectomicrobia bacterium]|nr:O-antigen ligase family protein [Candidatus Tectomicrobia bacterium]
MSRRSVPLEIIFVFLATNVGVLIAPVFGGNATFILAVSALLVVYLVLNFRDAAMAISRRANITWLFLLTLWPMVAASYSQYSTLRDYGLAATYGVVYFSAHLYFKNNGSIAYRRLMLIGIAVTGIGLLASLLAPELFYPAAQAVNATNYYHGRAYGFFLQPNMAALSLLSFLAGLSYSYVPEKRWALIVGVVAVFIMVALTGSRSGLFIFALLLIYSVWVSVRFANSDILVDSTHALLTVMILGGLICVFAGALFLFQQPAAGTAIGGLENRLIVRLSALGQLDIRDYVSTEGSLNARFTAQAEFLELIRDKPLLGYGIGAKDAFKARRLVSESSHNQFVRNWFEGGIVWLVAYVLALAAFIGRKATSFGPGAFKSRRTALVPIYLVLASLVSNGVLTSVTIILFVGATTGLISGGRRINSTRQKQLAPSANLEK